MIFIYSLILILTLIIIIAILIYNCKDKFSETDTTYTIDNYCALKLRNEEQIINSPHPISERFVWFEPNKPSKTPIYSRSKLRFGHALVGPAIIEQLDAVTVIFPGDTVKVDSSGNLIIKVK